MYPESIRYGIRDYLTKIEHKKILRHVKII